VRAELRSGDALQDAMAVASFNRDEPPDIATGFDSDSHGVGGWIAIECCAATGTGHNGLSRY
jgi:hypothetical protein